MGMRSRPKYSARPVATPPPTPSAMPPAMSIHPEPPATCAKRNSTTSEPSRSTASVTTTASAASGRRPTETSSPRACICIAIAFPWVAIQIACHAIIATAAKSTVALNSSWPIPAAASATAPADNARTTEPSTPATMPAPIQRARPGTPRVAANTTLTTSAASSTSRKTSTAIPATRRFLFRDQDTLRGVLVEVAEKGIPARLQRTDVDADLSLGGHDLLAIELVALELLRGIVLVIDDELHLLAGRNRNLRRLEAMAPDREARLGVLSLDAGRGDCQSEDANQAQPCPSRCHRGRCAVVTLIIMILINKRKIRTPLFRSPAAGGR